MRRLISSALGLAAGAGVILEARHIGVSVTALVVLVAVAVDAAVTLVVSYIWGELAHASRDVTRILRKAQQDTDIRRAADQAILDTVALARADW